MSSFIKLKDDAFLNNQRKAGKVVAMTLQLLTNLVSARTTSSLLELNALAEEYILANQCTPTFKNYKSFPAGVCISVNRQLVHGIPTDYLLQDGDVVSFDLGATYKNAIADAARTCIYGTPKNAVHTRLIKATEEALNEGIKNAVVGNRLGQIGNAIYNVGKKNGFSVVTDFGGHGICYDKDGKGIPHAPPFVSNRSDPADGIMMQPGLTLAIEPLFVIGSSAKTHVSNDGWTVSTNDISCHFEDTVFLHKDHTEVITKI